MPGLGSDTSATQHQRPLFVPRARTNGRISPLARHPPYFPSSRHTNRARPRASPSASLASRTYGKSSLINSWQYFSCPFDGVSRRRCVPLRRSQGTGKNCSPFNSSVACCVLRIIDSPGVVFDDHDHTHDQKESSVLLRNVIRPEDPISIGVRMLLFVLLSVVSTLDYLQLRRSSQGRKLKS